MLSSLTKRLIYLGIGLLIMLNACAPHYTITITLDPQITLPPHQNIKVFLLNEAARNEIEQIRANNGVYFTRATYKLQDSLRALYRQFILAAADKAKFESNYQTAFNQYRQELLPKINAECLQIQRTGDIWQCLIKISNQSAEQINRVTLTLRYKNNLLIDRKPYRVTIPPYSHQLLSSVYLDLSGKTQIQYSLASYPGGLEKLTRALTIQIDEIESDYNNFQTKYQVEFKACSDAELQAALQLEDYTSNQISKELQSLALPLNQILLNNLSEKALQKGNLNPPDTLRFTDNPAGNYHLVAFTTPTDSLQWLQTINLTGDYLLPLSPALRSIFFIRITPEITDKIVNIVQPDAPFKP